MDAVAVLGDEDNSLTTYMSGMLVRSSRGRGPSRGRHITFRYGSIPPRRRLDIVFMVRAGIIKMVWSDLVGVGCKDAPYFATSRWTRTLPVHLSVGTLSMSLQKYEL